MVDPARHAAPEWRAHGAAFAWTLLLLALLLSPGPEPGAPAFRWLSGFELPGVDLAVHALLFLGEVELLRRSLVAGRVARPLLWSALAAAALGLGTEIGQGWIPRRGTEASDLVADLVGVAAVIVWHRLRGGASSAGWPAGAP